QSLLLGNSLPNFYFHATTAYDINRQCGVEIGKRDFMGAPPSSGRPPSGRCDGVATKALWRPGSSSERSLPPVGRLKDHGRNARGPSPGSTPLATWTAHETG